MARPCAAGGLSRTCRLRPTCRRRSTPASDKRPENGERPRATGRPEPVSLSGPTRRDSRRRRAQGPSAVAGAQRALRWPSHHAPHPWLLPQTRSGVPLRGATQLRGVGRSAALRLRTGFGGPILQVRRNRRRGPEPAPPARSRPGPRAVPRHRRPLARRPSSPASLPLADRWAEAVVSVGGASHLLGRSSLRLRETQVKQYFLIPRVIPSISR